MGFRNPINGVPPSSIDGDMIAPDSIDGRHIVADAITAKHTLTGPLIRTDTEGNRRWELNSSLGSNRLWAFSGLSTEESHGSIQIDADDTAGDTKGFIIVRTPTTTDHPSDAILELHGGNSSSRLLDDWAFQFGRRSTIHTVLRIDMNDDRTTWRSATDDRVLFRVNGATGDSVPNVDSVAAGPLTVEVGDNNNGKFHLGWFNGDFTYDEAAHTIDIGAEILREAWNEPNLLNGYTYAGTGPTPAYFKDPTGGVHVKGRIEGTPGDVAFVLPSAYRPGDGLQYPVTDNLGNTARLNISPNGNVTPAAFDTWVNITCFFPSAM